MLASKTAVTPQFAGNAQCARPRAQRSGVVAQAAPQKQKLYIGFDKYDTKPREGRQGRFVTDDPGRYPQRNEYVGGWAGGEVGLKQFVEDYKKTQANPPPASKLNLSKTPKPIGKGSDTIYLGYSKSDLEARQRGEKGRVIKDDARKYPQRNELVGGFAGGELGLKTFAEKGDVPIADGSRRRKQQSPLVIAGLVAVSGTVGGLLISSLTEAVAGKL